MKWACVRSNFFISPKKKHTHILYCTGGVHAYSEDDIKCTFCGKLFATPGSKTRHIVTVHQKVEPHQCDICFRFYKNKNSLSAHKANHKVV